MNASYMFKQVFWIWIINALIHSSLLYWLPLLALTQDVAWANGRDGGYLLLGNFVYTVSAMRYFSHCAIARERFMKTSMKETRRDTYMLYRSLVCCSDSVREGRSNNKFVDMGHSFSNVGIYYTVVFIYFYI